MNDFLRPCNCVHPEEAECERCTEELQANPGRHACCGGKCERREQSTSCASGQQP